MSLRSQIESYLFEITARACSAQERCNTLLAYDFISKSPKDLARTISRICGFLSQAAVKIFSLIDWEDPDLVEPDLLHLRNADSLIRELAAHLRYVQGARADRLPWGIVPSFERIAANLVPDKQILLRTKWNYNYTVMLSDFRDAYLQSLEQFHYYLPEVDLEGDVLRDLKQPLHIIAFPSLERENILLHTLLGHELGHLFADRFLTAARKEIFKESIMSQIEGITDKELRHEGLTEAKPGGLFYDQIRKDRKAYNADLALEYWTRALEEILSDVVGAILFGPAALFSTIEMAIQQEYDLPPAPETSFYPPWRMRLREVLRIIEAGEPFFPVAAELFQSHDAENRGDRARRVNEKYEAVRKLCQSRSDFNAISAQPIAQLAYNRVEASVRDGTAFLLEDCGLGTQKNRATPKSVFRNIEALMERLDHSIPPNALERSVNDRKRISLVEIINAAWFYRASLAVPALTDAGTLNEESAEQRRRANRLTLKAIEFANLATDYWSKTRVKEYLPEAKAEAAKTIEQETMRRLGDVGGETLEKPWSGVMSASEIVSCMQEEALSQRLIVTPLLNPGESIGTGAIDVRLGNQFIIMKREAFPLLDVGNSETIDLDIERYQEKVIKPYGDRFILHPHQLVIGSTLEYIQLPPDLMCYVIGKSTWGRMGLIIATATKVDPGFRGCITLEIINEGEIPLVLYPGVPIAQLVFHRSSGKDIYTGGYSCSIGPEFPKFNAKKMNWRYWTRSE